MKSRPSGSMSTKLKGSGVFRAAYFLDRRSRPMAPTITHDTLSIVGDAYPLFSFERAIILDIDTTVNRSLDVLFDDVHPDPDYFTTFVRFSNSDHKWDKHVRFYDSAASEYEVNRLYCSIGMHAVHREWPHFERVVKYIDKMAKFKHEHGVRRAYVDEYSVNLISLQNGGKIHYPRQAIRKGRKASMTKREDVPFVWHFILGRTHCNPFWSQALRNAAEDDFLQIRRLL